MYFQSYIIYSNIQFSTTTNHKVHRETGTFVPFKEKKKSIETKKDLMVDLLDKYYGNLIKMLKALIEDVEKNVKRQKSQQM